MLEPEQGRREADRDEDVAGAGGFGTHPACDVRLSQNPRGQPLLVPDLLGRPAAVTNSAIRRETWHGNYPQD
jgi:hypothetical protein